ncbi:MAG: glycine reductase, partial [Clostridium sp.]
SAGLKDAINKVIKKVGNVDSENEVVMPKKVVVTFAIAGIDILELEDACKCLWKEGIYSESGMGCTGPIVLVPENAGSIAIEILRKAEFMN